jgi:hypothetical protein
MTVTSVGDANDEVEEPRINLSDTEPTADKDSMCDRKGDKDTGQITFFLK